MRKKILSIGSLFLALLCLGAVAAAGCGSSGSNTSLTMKEFENRAEAICNRAESEQLKRAVAYTKSHPNAEDKDLVEPVGLPPIEKEIEQLAALGMLEGKGATDAAELVDELEAGLEEAQKNPQSLLGSETPFDRSNELARKLGLNVCGALP
jgi:hypothetical protein